MSSVNIVVQTYFVLNLYIQFNMTNKNKYCVFYAFKLFTLLQTNLDQWGTFPVNYVMGGNITDQTIGNSHHGKKHHQTNAYWISFVKYICDFHLPDVKSNTEKYSSLLALEHIMYQF